MQNEVLLFSFLCFPVLQCNVSYILFLVLMFVLPLFFILFVSGVFCFLSYVIFSYLFFLVHMSLFLMCLILFVSLSLLILVPNYALVSCVSSYIASISNGFLPFLCLMSFVSRSCFCFCFFFSSQNSDDSIGKKNLTS